MLQTGSTPSASTTTLATSTVEAQSATLTKELPVASSSETEKQTSNVESSSSDNPLPQATLFQIPPELSLGPVWTEEVPRRARTTRKSSGEPKLAKMVVGEVEVDSSSGARTFTATAQWDALQEEEALKNFSESGQVYLYHLIISPSNFPSIFKFLTLFFFLGSSEKL